MDKPPHNEKHDTVDGVTLSPSIDNSESQLQGAMMEQFNDSYKADIKYNQKGIAHKDSTASTPKR